LVGTTLYVVVVSLAFFVVGASLSSVAISEFTEQLDKPEMNVSLICIDMPDNLLGWAEQQADTAALERETSSQEQKQTKTYHE